MTDAKTYIANLKKNLETFTDAFIKGLKPVSEAYELSDLGQPGLSIRVSPNGIKKWNVKITIKGAGQKRLPPIGVYGDADGCMSLAAARVQTQTLREQGAGGTDPVKEAEEKAKALADRKTMREVYNHWLAGKEKIADTPAAMRSLTDVKRMIEKDILGGVEIKRGKRAIERKLLGLPPEFTPDIVGTLPVQEFTLAHYRRVIRAIEERKSDYVQNRCHTYINVLLKHAIFKMDIEMTNPIGGKDRPFEHERVRDRVLSEAEMVSLWHDLDLVLPQDQYRHAATIIKLLIASGQRLRQITEFRLSWIVEKENAIEFPAWVMKGKERHSLPMNALMVSLIEEAKSRAAGDILFPSPADDTKAISRQTMTTLINQVREEFGLGDVRLHDTRRCFSTHARGLRYNGLRLNENHIERCMDHVIESQKKGSAKHYNFFEYIDEKREVMDSWGAYLTDNVIHPRPVDGSNVLPLKKKAA